MFNKTNLQFYCNLCNLAFFVCKKNETIIFLFCVTFNFSQILLNIANTPRQLISIPQLLYSAVRIIKESCGEPQKLSVHSLERIIIFPAHLVYSPNDACMAAFKQKCKFSFFKRVIHMHKVSLNIVVAVSLAIFHYSSVIGVFVGCNYFELGSQAFDDIGLYFDMCFNNQGTMYNKSLLLLP